MEFQLEAPVEIGPERLEFRFTHRVRPGRSPGAVVALPGVLPVPDVVVVLDQARYFGTGDGVQAVDQLLVLAAPAGQVLLDNVDRDPLADEPAHVLGDVRGVVLPAPPDRVAATRAGGPRRGLPQGPPLAYKGGRNAPPDFCD